jgi:hypothetical protein
MKIALYIADGLEQIILTPEDDCEAAILKKLPAAPTITVHTGQFYQGRDHLYRSAPAGYSSVRDSTYLYLVKEPEVQA